MNWSEYKPALTFLAKFLGIYFVLNIGYAVFIESYDNQVDPVTWSISEQTSSVLNTIGYKNAIEVNPLAPTALFTNGDTHSVLISVYEGCNGINVAIIFLAFVVAFGGDRKAMLWFIPTGLIIIHLANLGRIAGLFIASTSFEEYFYFFHKYLFTATIYAVVFILWIVWVLMAKKFYKNARQ